MITETATLARPKTGRAVVLRKRRVDECARIDLRDLRRSGFFVQPMGVGWSIPGSHLAYARYEDATLGRWFVIADVGPNRAGPVRALLLAARLEWMRCHFGGGRWWFACPRVLNGRECGSRVRVLLLPPGTREFGCRRCWRLTYRSRQQHRSWFSRTCGLIESIERLLADLHATRGWRRYFRAMCRIDPEYRRVRRAINELDRARRSRRDDTDG